MGPVFPGGKNHCPDNLDKAELCAPLAALESCRPSARHLLWMSQELLLTHS